MCAALALCSMSLVCRAAGRKAENGGSWARSGRPVQLTHGEGNDMEASVGPDGRIAYENDADGGIRICLLDPSSGQTEVVAGGGKGVMAAYPGWTPDGGLVYALSAPTGTAAVQVPADGDIGCNLWLWKDGGRTRLTRGLWRDFTPSVSPDGRSVWFTTSRGRRLVGDGSHLARLALDQPGFPVEENKEIAYSGGAAAVSPVLSPRGGILAWAQADSAFANWVIMLGKAADPSANCRLTNAAQMSCYAPRWSPDGEYVACTGYQVGDPGWSVYVIHVRSGRIARLDCGRGNSKSPCWTPDGKALVYENNATGVYKLYRITVALTPPKGEPVPDKEELPGRLTAMWLPPGADGKSLWNGAAGGSSAGTRLRDGVYLFPKPAGIDFGDRPFYVKATFRQTAMSGEPKVIVAAYYGFCNSAPAWQFYVDSANRLRFASRNMENGYVDAAMGTKLELGKEYTAVGVHYPDGRMLLALSGQKPIATAVEPCQFVTGATRLAVGSAGSAQASVFPGQVLAVECGIGVPPEVPRNVTVKSLLKLEGR